MSSPYKHYLEFLDQNSGSAILHKLLIVASVFIFIATGAISALYYYKYQKETPKRQQYQYLKATAGDFSSASQSISELLQAFRVAGDKVTKIDTAMESSQSASGFFVALDDLERNLSKIKVTEENIEGKRLSLAKKPVPQVLIEFKGQILDFYEEAQTVLLALYKNHLFAKQLLLASGPKFYLPQLSEDNLWEISSKEKILDYYKNTKDEANTALRELAKLSPPSDFKPYYDSQIAYLTILITLSDNIINTLSVADDKDSESATQIEKAYQLLVGARRENEPRSKKILEEKLKIVALPENLNRLSAVEIHKNSIMENLELATNATFNGEEPSYVRFLRGLQIPMGIW